MNPLAISVWLHVLAGITWIGLLYYFNFVQVPGLGAAKADGTAPGITKHIAPRALLWFRWGAVATWVTGAGAMQHIFTDQGGIVAAMTFGIGGVAANGIAMGAWLGTIMLFNVWAIIWPNQKKVLGIVDCPDDAKPAAARQALLASRVNTLLSIPMVMFMVSFGHGGSILG